MSIGHLLQRFLSPVFAEKIGGIILIILGVWIIYQFFRSEKEKDILLPHEKMIVNLEIKSLGLVIHILKKPMSADFDKSGTITGWRLLCWAWPYLLMPLVQELER